MSHWFHESDCSLDAFVALVERKGEPELAFATDVQRDIPLYDCAELGQTLADSSKRRALQAEWADVLSEGAGVFVLRRAYADTAVIDEATSIFDAIVRRERDAGGAGGDHFAKAGANDRIWNAQEKLCLCAPAVFARYFANPFIACAAQAWLGPGYQMTSQVNVVRPGGAAQEAHRDYHLGFQTADEAQRYPAHVHTMSPLLTLQGAVAHSDMPVESGPTKLLPFSQRYAPGYLAWRRPDFRAYFESRCVQLPLSKGDALFFSPSLFHAAGANRTRDVQRMANLLQVSSAYGRAMETVDRTSMCKALYPVLAQGTLSADETDAAIASCAEGYAFPTNLDRDPPIGGLAPASQQAVMRQALEERWTVQTLASRLDENAWRRLTA